MERTWWTRKRVVIVSVVACLLIASTFAAVDGIVRASRIASEASDGIHHLRTVEALLQHPPSSPAATSTATPGSTPTPTPTPTPTSNTTSGSGTGSLGALLNATALQQIKTELTAADADFSHLRADLAQPGGTLGVAAHTPGLSDTVSSFSMLAAAADEGCRAGLDLVGIGQTAVGILKGGMFASSTKPAPGTPPSPQLDAKTYAAVQAAFQDASGHFDAAASYLGAVNLDAIPSQVLKPSERTLLSKVIAGLPQARQTLTQANAWLSVLGSLTGVGTSSSYLVELMDRSELRATGGFIGNYGVMTVTNGKVQPFDLSDSALLDAPFVSSGASVPLPQAYFWWPFRGFGLRDSNLSASFPASAQIGMQALKLESGQSVQGVIAVTPTAIARALTVVGNLQVVIPGAGVNETVTSQNLEAKIHYYQQTRGRDPITGLPPSDQVSSPRKRFTALLGRAFMEKLHGLSTSQLSALVQVMVENIHARDVQVYFANQSAEKLVAANGDDSSLAHGPGDGLTVVDDNVGFNKGSQFNVITIADNVIVGANGVATHQLALTYNFRVTDPTTLFGPDRYLTYLRIYAPQGAQLIHEDGFQNILGEDQIGHSDTPGRQMWGGYVIVQDGAPYTLHLTWKVGNVLVKDSAGNPQYDLDVQRQPGANMQLALTIAGAGAKTAGVNDKRTLTDDAHYSVPLGCLANPPCPATVTSGAASKSGSGSGQSLVPVGAGSGPFGSAAALLGSGVVAWLDRRLAA